MNEAMQAAILAKIAFRGDSMTRYQAAAIMTAMAEFPGEVGADDIPAEFKPDDQTTAGCAWALLKADGVHLFCRVGRRSSRDPARRAAWINTYRLTSPVLARTWLARHGYAAPEMKGQMVLL